MRIIISEPKESVLVEHGWKAAPGSPLYHKKFNKCSVIIQVSYYDLSYECWIPNSETPTPDDLVSIAKELKNLEKDFNNDIG